MNDPVPPKSMPDYYVGSIVLWAGNKIPKNWISCEGQVLSIKDFPYLYPVIGTTYGGDGKNTFCLPDFRNKIPVGMGKNPAGSNYPLGQTGGNYTVTLNSDNIAPHGHLINFKFGNNAILKTQADSNDPKDRYPAMTSDKLPIYGSVKKKFMGENSLPVTLDAAGGGKPISIVQPFLALNFIICYDSDFLPIKETAQAE